MSVHLCHFRAEHPYYYEELDKNLYSIEELSYALVNFPALIPKELVKEDLLHFLEQELAMKALAEKLRMLLSVGESQEKLLSRILRAAGYYPEKEINAFTLSMQKWHGMEEGEKALQLGDTFFRLGKYGRARDAYQDAYRIRPELRESLRLADTEALLGQLEEALSLLSSAYRRRREDSVLRKIDYLLRLEPGLRLSEDIRAALTEEKSDSFFREYDRKQKAHLRDPELLELRELREKDEGKFREQASRLLGSWKEQMRNRV